ncbi:MAG: dihydroneopterin aldolase [Eudoraea sp.]|nr:dihydroneopterin aldolase [Eudoraea sp.]
MDTIEVKNIRLYAYHGCLKEESIIGSDYIVDVLVNADLKKASRSDNLEDTADYVLIHRIVKEEMAIASKLLEHVAARISNRILAEIPLVKKGVIGVSKINPPIGGDVEKVSIKIPFTR